MTIARACTLPLDVMPPPADSDPPLYNDADLLGDACFVKHSTDKTPDF